mmetsp:Transcript_10061/g.45586  ORF Transcript_10061/g.45586 Transcript_10061/m.45586 type:complete len:201 (+) Transcript_10061:413-1015(+)
MFPGRAKGCRDREGLAVHRGLDGWRRRVPVQDVPDGRTVLRVRPLLPSGEPRGPRLHHVPKRDGGRVRLRRPGVVERAGMLRRAQADRRRFLRGNRRRRFLRRFLRGDASYEDLSGRRNRVRRVRGDARRRARANAAGARVVRQGPGSAPAPRRRSEARGGGEDGGEAPSVASSRRRLRRHASGVRRRDDEAMGRTTRGI